MFIYFRSHDVGDVDIDVLSSLLFGDLVFDDNMVLGELCRFCHQGKQIISDLLISEARGRAFP